MNILNIEQIAIEVADELFLDGIAVGHNPTEFLRRCLNKLAEQVGVEPVAWVGRIEDGAMLFMEPPTDWEATPLYTETQLIAAQQKAAEACAKACEDEIGNTPNDQRMIAAIDCAVVIRNGEWREYL